MFRLNLFILLIAAAGAAQGIALAAMLLIKKKFNQAVKILAFLIFLMGCNLLSGFFRISDFVEVHPFVFYLIVPNSLFGLLFFLYIKSLCTNSKITLKDTKLFIPSLMLVAWQLFAILHPLGGDLSIRVKLFKTGTLTREDILYSLFSIIHNIFFLAISFKYLDRYEKFIRDTYSNIDRINLKWLYTLSKTQLVFWLLNFLIFILYLMNWYNGLYLHGIILICGTILVYTIGFKYFLFIDHEKMPPGADSENDDNKKEGDKYGGMRLSQERAIRIAQKIDDYIKSSGSWKKSGFSLKNLSDETNIQLHYISQAINRIKNMNFYSYINGYRLDETEKRLSDPSNEHESVISIAFDCGFNSKSTFNSLFRKRHGITPSQFRKNKLNDIS